VTDYDLTVQDWGVTYDELEPYYDKFDQICGTSGKAGNLKGQIQPGGNLSKARARRNIDAAMPQLTARPCSAKLPQN